MGGVDVRGNLPSTAIVTPAIAPGENLGFGVLVFPLPSPVAAELGFSELAEAGKVELVGIEDDGLVDKMAGIDVGLIVETVENVLRLC